MALTLEKFCLCCKLRNGAVVVGFLCIFVYATLLTLHLHVKSETFDYIRSDEVIGLRALLYFTYYDQFWPTFPPACWVIGLITSILLVIGAVGRTHFLMLPWIIVNGIFFIPCTVATVVLLIIGLPFYGPIYIWWSICSAFWKAQENTTLSKANVGSVLTSEQHPQKEFY